MRHLVSSASLKNRPKNYDEPEFGLPTRLSSSTPPRGSLLHAQVDAQDQKVARSWPRRATKKHRDRRAASEEGLRKRLGPPSEITRNARVSGLAILRERAATHRWRRARGCLSGRKGRFPGRPGISAGIPKRSREPLPAVCGHAGAYRRPDNSGPGIIPVRSCSMSHLGGGYDGSRRGRQDGERVWG